MKPEEKVLRYYTICHRLKDVVRTGWMRWGVKRSRLETVAEHIYGTQMLALAMKSEYKYDIDIEKVILMLAIHEIGEAIIGDFVPFEIDAKEKARREHAAVAKILEPLVDGETLNALFEEFDAKKTKEAKFAYQCDKLECDIQCKFYDEEGCVDLKAQKNNQITEDELVAKLIWKGESWSSMWLKFDQQKIKFDKNFKAISDYLIANDLAMIKYDLDPKVVEYVQTKLLPEYEANDEGHQLPHIEYVIRRSLKFAEQVPEVDYNMVYVIAAYHDIKKYLDADHHEELGAKALLEDENLRQLFSDEQIKTMSEAVADHRASNKNEPRSIYGKIVSSADRSTDLGKAIRRTASHVVNADKQASLDEVTDFVMTHLVKKFGKNGYARGKCYFEDPEYESFLSNVVAATETKEKFKEEVKAALGW